MPIAIPLNMIKNNKFGFKIQITNKTINMSRDSKSKQETIRYFGERAKACITDNQKIEFFDSSKEAFFYDSDESSFSLHKNIPKDLDDAFYVFANMKKLNETELDELKSMQWNEYSKNFKIFLFDFCILNGEAYSKYFFNRK